MNGLNLPSFAKAALVAASLFASIGATASYADVAQQIGIARSSHAVVQSSTRAQYHPAAPTSGQSGKCVGGYSWTQRSFNVHRTDSQMMLPMPCH